MSAFQSLKLGALGTFHKGSGIKRDDVISSGVACIRYGEIYTRFGDYTDSLESCVSPEVAGSAFKLTSGDIVFAGSGETKAEIGKCVAWTGENDAVVGGDTIILRRHNQDPIFLASLLNSKSIAAQKSARGQGDAVVHISVRSLKDIDISLPSLPEQKRIAGVIEDADDLVNSLERLIAKKQAIKTGMMQQLLTGRTRLPGFSSEWAKYEFREVLKVRHGRNQKLVEDTSGSYPILATGGQIGWANKPLYTKPSVLIGRKGTIDRPQFRDTPFWTVDTLFYTEIYSGFDPKYIYYLFLMVDWRSKNEASGVPSLNASSVENVSMPIPSIEEQVAIRKVLDCTDDEISVLKSRLEKAKAIKQGMMQELLTGKTRLLEEGAAS